MEERFKLAAGAARTLGPYLYVESDGNVFLVRRGGRLALPTADEVPFEVVERVALNLEEADVRFCTPADGRFRAEWIPKDRVPGLADVEPLVQRAVNATLVREVTAALVVDREDVLLVKAARGFGKGLWNVPGGFVLYGETPGEGVVREVREEVGLAIEPLALVGVYTMRFSSPYFMRCHAYRCRAASRDARPDADEIAEVRWMRVREAYDVTGNPFARRALEALLRE